MAQRRLGIRKINGWIVFFIILSAILIIPVGIILVYLFIPHLELYQHLVSTVLPRYLGNTFILSVSVILITLILGTSFAFLVTHYDFPFRKGFQWMLGLPLVIPPYILGFTYAGIFDYTGTLTYILKNILGIPNPPHLDILNMGGLILMISLSFYPYVYLIVRSSFEKHSMRLSEIARLHGYSRIETFFKLLIPITRPAIAAGLALVIMETLNDFGTSKLFGVDTFTTGIFRTWFSMSDRDSALHLAGILLLFVMILLLTERFFRKNARYDFQSATYIPLKRIRLKPFQSALAIGSCLLLLLPGFFIPVVQQSFWMVQSAPLMFRFDLLKPLLTTVGLSLTAVVIIIALSLFLNYCYRIFRSRKVYLINKFNTIGYAVPGAVLALGVMIFFGFIDHRLIDLSGFFTGKPIGLLLTQSYAMLVFAYVLRFLTVGFNSFESGFSKIPLSVHEASRNLGSSRLKTLLRIELPLLKPAMVSALILVMMELIKELPLSLILRPFNADLLATKAYEYAVDERIVESSYYSMMIITLGVALLWLITLLNRYKKKEQ